VLLKVINIKGCYHNMQQILQDKKSSPIKIWAIKPSTHYTCSNNSLWKQVPLKPHPVSGFPEFFIQPRLERKSKIIWSNISWEKEP